MRALVGISELSLFAVCMHVHEHELLSSDTETGRALTMASAVINMEAAHQRLGGRLALRAAAA